MIDMIIGFVVIVTAVITRIIVRRIFLTFTFDLQNHCSMVNF